MTTISCHPVLRTQHPDRLDKVLSTFLLRYPRWIHAEFMTHRVFSRNAASSRAIPVDKLINDVLENPARPIFWGKNRKGMQATEAFTGVDREIMIDLWDASMQSAVHFARLMNSRGAHKQLVNRLLEPYSHITVLVSSTEWDNFLALRDHPAAEPHIQLLAKEIRKELGRTDNINRLKPGAFHLPFISLEEMLGSKSVVDLIKLSVARCASTSYKTVDGFDMTLERAKQVYEGLVTADVMHASPLEHVAQVDHYHNGEWAFPHLHGNFEGFQQWRKLVEQYGAGEKND